MMGKSYLAYMIARSYSSLRHFFHRRSEYEQMEEYLSQAENNVHLEILQKRWDLGYRP
jgi:hypothetical protein